MIKCFPESTSFKDSSIEYKCLFCNKNYQKQFNVQFFNIYKFSMHDINKYILLFQRGVYPYDYMDYWEKFNEVSFH